ncbi:MAG: hypothetical protein WC614_12045 [bacterium]
MKKYFCQSFCDVEQTEKRIGHIGHIERKQWIPAFAGMTNGKTY